MRTGYTNGNCGTKPFHESREADPRTGARRQWLALPGIGAGMLLTTIAAGADSNPWIEVAGRTHPILVHFPIALLAAASFFEVVRIITGRDRPSPAAVGCLILAVLGAAGAGTSGWLLADDVGRVGETEVELHRWIAIGGACVALVALVLSAGAKQQSVRRLYVLCLLLGATAVGVAGHFGGELVYGEGYVLAPLSPKPERAPTTVVVVDPSATPVSFERDVHPIFAAHCIECHGAEKQKGKLRLDSAATLVASAHYDEVVIPGDPKSSLLYELISLPPDDHDFMPKQGEPLSAWQIETIRTWIEHGATFEGLELDAEDLALRPVEPVEEGVNASAPPSADVQVELGEAVAAVRSRGGFASLVASDVPELIVNYSIVSPPLTEQDIAVLMPVADRVVELNVGGVGVTDALVPQIAGLSGLKRLNMSRSQISNAALVPLAGLSELEVLNLYGCPIDSEGVDAIARIAALKRLYVWQTGMDGSGVQRLRELRADLEVIAGDEPGSQPEAPASTEEPAADGSGEADGGE